MNKNQLIRYLVRLLATVLNISTCITLGVLSIAYLAFWIKLIKLMLPPNEYTILGGGGGAVFSASSLLCCVLFGILFIRSLWATTEARYPQKLFRRLARGIAWCFILSTLAFIAQVSLILPKGFDRIIAGLPVYFMGLGASLLMLIPALQFWRPSATKTWVLNAVPLLLYSSLIFVPREFLSLIMVRVMQLLS